MVVAALVALAVVGAVPIRVRRRVVTDPVDAHLVGRLVVLGLGAGLSVQGALALAGAELGGETGRAVRTVVHEARRGGLAAVGPIADPALRPLLGVLARAMAVGAPVAAEVSVHVREAERDRRSEALARAKALPVRLTLPLTFLILPGCALLLVGPVLLESFASLPGGDLLP